MDPMMFGPKPSSPPTPLTIHYYGDIVRALLLAAGAIVLVFSPSHPELMPLGTLPVVIVILLSVLLAGLTSPKQIGVMFANAAVSALGSGARELTLSKVDTHPLPNCESPSCP